MKDQKFKVTPCRREDPLFDINASPRTSIRIQDPDVRQSFQEKCLLLIGGSSLATPTGLVRI